MRLAVFGANGGAGRALVAQALDAGHDVAAVTRHPEQFGLRHDRLEVVRADATDSASVARVIEGKDAVLSSLGVPYTFKEVTVYSVPARHIIEAMQRDGLKRLIVVSSSAVDLTMRSESGFLLQHVLEPFLTRVVGRTAYDDMRRMEEAVRGSGLDWTIVRPPALFTAQAVGRYEASTTPPHGSFASRQDLAALLLDSVVANRFIREVPFIVSRDDSPSHAKVIFDDAIKPHLPRVLRR